MKRLFIGIIFTLILFESKAQMFTNMGARANGLANATVAVPDAFSIFANPACLSGLSGQVLGVYADQRYNIAGLNTFSAVYTIAYKSARLGTGVARYGDELLNQTRGELAFAYKIRMVSLGGGLGYQQLLVSELGMAKSVTFQFGGVAEITPKLTYGASVYNLARAKIVNESYYPVVMRMGFAYKANKQVVLMGEAEKTSLQAINMKASLEYSPIEFLRLRTGINTFPSQGFFGIGVKWKSNQLDYACSFHSRLGFVHYIALAFHFEGARKEE